MRGGESVSRSFDKFNGEQFRDNSDGELLLCSVTETSCIGTLILHISYPSPQVFHELNERDKCAKVMVHVSQYDANVIFSTPVPSPPFPTGGLIIDKISFL